MKNLNKQKGFTLIELVVVIVILGILAVTAAPKFIDLTSDAKGSVIEAVKGSMNSAADLVHAKAIVAGKLASSGQAISAAGANIDLVFGWPNEASIGKLLELGDDMTELSGSIGSFTHEDATTEASCFAAYDDSTASATARPDITTTVSGC